MVVPVFVVVLIGVAWLCWRDLRAALVVFLSGLGALGVVGFLSATRGVWPDLPLPWALILNPYLVITWGYLGTLAGAVGVIRHGFKRAFGR
jgi:hypothetical protein